MAWLLLDFAVLAVFLRAAVLAFQSLVIGGLAYVAVVGSPAGLAARPATERCRRGIWWASLVLATVHLLYLAVDTAILIGTLQIPLRGVITADYFLASAGAVLASTILLITMRKSGAPLTSRARFLLPTVPAAAALLAASIWTSHSVSRLDHRFILVVLTGIHQLAVATWIGAMPYLLVSLRVVQDREGARFMARRFSTMAVISVAGLIGAGMGLSYIYVGSWPALYGTAYGFMIISKSALLIVLLALGAINWWLVRSLNGQADKNSARGPSPALERTANPLLILRRVGEAELGIGFSIILAAASLTSQPPAVDLVQDRLTAQEIVERYHPVIPRFTTPSLNQLSPATPLEEAIRSYDTSAVAQAHNQDPDIAWSEYTHHWSGIIVLMVGAGALFAARFPRFRWARNWPLGFLALSIFVFLRADSENWPLGPLSFWKSFYDPEVALHRVYVLLIAVFALFQWGVETGRLHSRKAAYVFPLLMAAGGAGFLLHNHALGNIKNELLIEMSHNFMGILGLFAGLGRLMEIRLPVEEGGRISRIAAQVWPICLVMIGCVLLNYREA